VSHNLVHMESVRLAVDMASGRAAAQDSFVLVEDNLQESDHHIGCCHIGEADRCSFHLVEDMDYEPAEGDMVIHPDAAEEVEHCHKRAEEVVHFDHIQPDYGLRPRSNRLMT